MKKQRLDILRILKYLFNRSNSTGVPIILFRRKVGQMTTILKRPFLAGIGLFIYGSSTYAAYHAYRIYQLPEPAKDCYLPQNQFNREEAYNNMYYSVSLIYLLL